MIPRERHADAVAAARKWRDEERQRQAKLLPAGAALPADGERIKIVWPDGEHDFVMEFAYVDPKMAGAPEGWCYLHGPIVEPESWHGRPWSFLVHWVVSQDDKGKDTSAWTMLPCGGRLADVQLQDSEAQR